MYRTVGQGAISQLPSVASHHSTSIQESNEPFRLLAVLDGQALALLQAREKVNWSMSGGFGLRAAALWLCGLYESEAGQPWVAHGLKLGIKWQEFGQQGAFSDRRVI